MGSALPVAKVVDQIDAYHGVKIHDPYRWLEETDSPDARSWIDAQNRFTFSFLEQIHSRDWIRSRLTSLWDFPKKWAPLKKGGRFFQIRNTGLQNQDVLFVLKSPRDRGRVLLDPNALSPDGTVSVMGWSVSKDGRWLAYSTSSVGSDWLTWRIRDVASGRDLPDLLEWSKFSGAEWLPDGSGFYYGRYDPPEEGKKYTGPNYFEKLFFHRVKTPQAKDVHVYHRPDQKEWGFAPIVSDDGRYLILHVWQGTDSRNRLFYRDLQSEEPVVEVIPDLEAAYHFVGNDGAVFYFRTDLDAPFGKLIAIDLKRPQRKAWRTLIAETKDTLEGVKMIHDEFVALYLHDAHHVIRRFNRSGKPIGDIPLPTLGSIYSALPNRGFNGEREDDELFFAFHSFVHPLTVYRFDFESGKTETLFRPPIEFDLTPYVTRQVFATSKDGTKVPMFLVHKKGLRRNGRNPTILYGYGGFNIALTPLFDVSRLVWFEMGGVLAFANLRGGGEYGEEWHKAGMLRAKQNVFDDFVACAEWLIRNRYTSRAKLAIQGRSNGGLLVGASMTQRPELFGACLPAVGVMDMLRFHKFTIGWAWTSDYGNPDDPEDFKVLHAYSPYHNLRDGVRYPPTLVTTSDHDDRVVPAHSFKFAARLQAAQGGDAPTFIRIQTKAGHGIGRPTKFLIEENADILAFLTKVFAMKIRTRARNGS